MADLLAVLPHRGIAAAGPVALRQLRRIFDQSPRPHVIAGLAGRPVVENDLVEHETTMFVVEVVELDEINRLTGHVLLGRNPEGYKTSADSRNKGTHRSPPC